MRPRAMATVGLLLIGVSAPPITTFVREERIERSVSARYSVTRVISPEPGMEAGALEAEIGGHRVKLVDEHPLPRGPVDDDRLERQGTVRIVVDGQTHATPVEATVRVHMRDANRYWGYAYLQRLSDREGAERVVVSQRLPSNTYRTVSVFPDGAVVEDEFSYEDRCEPPLRALLIRNVVPHPSGYCSDAFQSMPGPASLLYPWASAAAGILLLGFALVATITRRAAATAR